MELDLLLWIQTVMRTPALDLFFTRITYLGDKGLIWIGLCLLFCCFRQTRRAGIITLLTLLLGMLLGEGVIKHLVNRPRPYEVYTPMALLIPPQSTSSFPSGHTTASFIAWIQLTVYLERAAGAYACASLVADPGGNPDAGSVASSGSSLGANLDASTGVNPGASHGAGPGASHGAGPGASHGAGPGASVGANAGTGVRFLRLRKGLYFAIGALAVLIPFSRLYLFVHYPTDLLGGIILGAACSVAVQQYVKKIAVL